MNQIPARQIRASFHDKTIRVYQAYGDAIADAALEAGTFVAPSFKMSRMTWIKPSFLWMMYRCGWAQKDAGQNRVLAIDIDRIGWEWALAHSVLSEAGNLADKAQARALLDANPVRVQWDPERNLHFHPLQHRSIQVGLTGEAVDHYVHRWIVNIEEITELAVEIGGLVTAGQLDKATKLLPLETPYPVSNELGQHIELTTMERPDHAG
jgi:Domain of unknown function (DUF4291)